MRTPKIHYKKLVVALVLPFLAALIGNLATSSNITSWYAYLDKPGFSPPNWLFGPVWTLLYLLMGIALYIVWAKRVSHSKRAAFTWFGIQLVFNTLWSIVFFGLHAPWAAVGVIVTMIISITATIRYFWPVSRAAGYLLLPYLAWVLFATYLNIIIAVLN